MQTKQMKLTKIEKIFLYALQRKLNIALINKIAQPNFTWTTNVSCFKPYLFVWNNIVVSDRTGKTPESSTNNTDKFLDAPSTLQCRRKIQSLQEDVKEAVQTSVIYVTNKGHYYLNTSSYILLFQNITELSVLLTTTAHH